MTKLQSVILPEFPKYVIFRDGGVWNGSKMLKSAPANGYMQIRLVKIDGSYKAYALHRIIACAFHGMDLYDLNFEPNHLNLIKTDNRADNLEVTTKSGNMLHYYRTKIKEYAHSETHKICRDCKISKLHLEFGKKSTADGLCHMCNSCRKIYRNKLRSSRLK